MSSLWGIWDEDGIEVVMTIYCSFFGGMEIIILFYLLMLLKASRFENSTLHFFKVNVKKSNKNCACANTENKSTHLLQLKIR